jgi:hypothetical protein
VGVVEGQQSKRRTCPPKDTKKSLEILLFCFPVNHGTMPIFFRQGIFSQQTGAVVLQCNKS